MKYIKTFKIFESSEVLDTIDDILIELNNDIDGWSAKTFKKYEGDTLPKDDVVVIIQRKGNFEEGRNELEVIKSMRIPNDVIDTITRLMDFMIGYKCNIFIGYDDDAPTGPVEELKEVTISNGVLTDRKFLVTELWMDEFIRIEFTK